jgi:hypothetical protein
MMKDQEAIQMMQRCAHELRDLRSQINNLATKAEAYEVIRDVVNRFSQRGGIVSEDLVWTLEKKIKELQSKPEVV